MRICKAVVLTLLLAAPYGVASTTITDGPISWTFSENDLVSGQYCDGSWYVVGNPLTLTAITPADPDMEDEVDIHGSVLNPIPDITTPYLQGWDSRITLGSGYDRTLNIARALPKSISSGSSIVSVSSYASYTDDKHLEYCRVLTIVSAAPAAGSFRPPYAGTDKTVRGTLATIDYDRLMDLAAVTATPTLSDTLTNLGTGVRLDVILQFGNSSMGVGEVLWQYGREVQRYSSTAILVLNLNYTDSEKEPIATRIIQQGIDVFGCAKAGMIWWPNGGHNQGRKLLLMTAARLLGDTEMMSWANNTDHVYQSATYGPIPRFQEDGQTTYVVQADVDFDRTYDYLSSPSEDPTSAGLGDPEWMSNSLWGSSIGQAYTSSERDSTQNLWGKSYQYNNWQAACGAALAARLMGLEDEWDWPAYFAYWDNRWEPSGASASTTFVQNMIDAYYNQTPLDDPSGDAPTAPSGVTATAKAYDGIDVTWSDNSSDETYFRIETSPDESTWTVRATADANSEAYALSGLNEATLYYVRVGSVNGFGVLYGTSASATTNTVSARSAPSAEQLRRAGL